ncbi:hypothetical protein HDU84_008625 [Entophlyctis sp. JEL0112]|nr:hypothetical protein HDU84_008625 [Entophlyctis sp. JEL0112]
MVSIALILTVLDLVTNVSAADLCAPLSNATTTGNYAFVLASAVTACYSQFNVTEDDKKAQTDAIKGYFNQYPYLDVAANAVAPHFPLHENFFAALDAIVADTNATTEVGLKWAIEDQLNALQDAHIYIGFLCFNQARFLQPFGITLANGVPIISKLLDTIYGSDDSLYNKWYNVLWGDSLKGKDARSLIGSTVVAINGQDPLDYIQAYADKYFGISHSPETRINYMFDSYTWSNAAVTSIWIFGRNTRPDEAITYQLRLQDGTLFTTGAFEWIARISASSLPYFATSDLYYTTYCTATNTPRKRDFASLPIQKYKTVRTKLQQFRYEDLSNLESDVNVSTSITGDSVDSFFILSDNKTGVWALSAWEPSETTDQAVDDWVATMTTGLAALVEGGATRLIIDLSSNGGGLIAIGWAMANYLLYPKKLTPVEYVFRLSKAGEWVLKNGNQVAIYNNMLGGIAFENGTEITDFSVLLNPGTTIKGYPAPYTNIFNYGDGSSIIDAFPPVKSWDPSQLLIVTNGFCGSTCAQFTDVMRDQGGVRTVTYGGGNKRTISGSKAFDPTSFAAGDIIILEVLKYFFGSANVTGELLPVDFRFPVDLGGSQIPFWTSYSPDGIDPTFPTEWNIHPSEYYLGNVTLNDPLSVYNEILAQNLFDLPATTSTTTASQSVAKSSSEMVAASVTAVSAGATTGASAGTAGVTASGAGGVTVSGAAAATVSGTVIVDGYVPPAAYGVLSTDGSIYGSSATAAKMSLVAAGAVFFVFS